MSHISRWGTSNPSHCCENFLYAIKGGSLRSPPQPRIRVGVRPLRADLRVGGLQIAASTSLSKSARPGRAAFSSLPIVSLTPAASRAPAVLQVIDYATMPALGLAGSSINDSVLRREMREHGVERLLRLRERIGRF